jgi:hypothetical protein
VAWQASELRRIKDDGGAFICTAKRVIGDRDGGDDADIATTMRSSISEKPSWRLVFISF